MASRPGLFAQWRASQSVIIVPMGGVQFVSFQQMPAIGTEALGACHVVVIASIYGAILAHIPPIPEYPSPLSGEGNVRFMMSQVASLYQHYRSFFQSADTVVVCGWHEGILALPDQRDIMTSSLRQLGLNPVVRTYHVPGNRLLPGQGTMIVIGGANYARPQIYLEDRLV
ncbi:hypothetical protein N7490_005191 [Penicillium lividum]|nr:hypothetical protein N7490_005191 [Penicillium lividum]